MSISNTSNFTLPSGTKQKRVKAYKEHVATNPALVLAADGLPLTDKHYFEGLLRSPAGLEKKVGKTKINPNFELTHIIFKAVQVLSTQAATWNDTVYKTASEQLYVILAHVYKLHGSIVEKEKNVKAVREAIVDFAVNKQHLTVKSSTSNMCLLVSCVFKTVPAQRRSAYGLGLQTLLNNFGPNLSEEEVVQHIVNAGGIYELAHPDNAIKKVETVDDKNEEIKELATKLQGKALLTLNSEHFANLLKQANTPYVAIVSKDDAGQITVRALSDSDSTVLSATKASFVEPKQPKQSKGPKKPKLVKPVKLSATFAKLAKDPAYQKAA